MQLLPKRLRYQPDRFAGILELICNVIKAVCHVLHTSHTVVASTASKLRSTGPCINGYRVRVYHNDICCMLIYLGRVHAVQRNEDRSLRVHFLDNPVGCVYLCRFNSDGRTFYVAGTVWFIRKVPTVNGVKGLELRYLRRGQGIYGLG